MCAVCDANNGNNPDREFAGGIDEKDFDRFAAVKYVVSLAMELARSAKLGVMQQGQIYYTTEKTLELLGVEKEMVDRAVEDVAEQMQNYYGPEKVSKKTLANVLDEFENFLKEFDSDGAAKSAEGDDSDGIHDRG